MIGAVFLALSLHAVPEIHVGYRGGERIDLDLTRIPGIDGDGYPLYLEREAAGAWLELLEAAAKNGYHLRPTYAYRTKTQQLKLRKQSRRLAARVGHSLHQQGLAIDISGMTHKGRPTDLRRWLRKEAHKYGFRPSKREPWHFTFDKRLRKV